MFTITNTLSRIAHTVTIGGPLDGILIDGTWIIVGVAAIMTAATYWRCALLAMVCWTDRPSGEALRAIGLSVLMITAIPAGVMFAGTAEADVGQNSSQYSLQTGSENVSYYDDFENGNRDGWVVASGPDSNVNVVNESYNGNYSLQSLDNSRAEWSDGRTFNSQENFEITGTYKASGSEYGVQIGLYEAETDQWAAIHVRLSSEEDRIYLDSGDKADPPGDSSKIKNNAHQGEWVKFRYEFSNGQMRAKVWPAGSGEPTEWQMERDAPENVESQLFIRGGSSDNSNREILLDEVDVGQHAITGQVVDQNGDPVENATVEAVGVDYTALNDTIEDKEARANELLSEAENPLPDRWNGNLDLAGQDGHFAQSDANYVAVHTTDDWQLGGSQLPGTEYQLDVDPELQQPDLIAPNDDTLILSVWDPSDTGGVIRDREDAADSDLPGRTDSGTIVIEQISPSGEVVDRMTRDTQPYVTMNPSWSFSTKTHEAVAVDLPNNHFYRIYPEGSEESAYTIARGSPSEMSHALTQELTTEAGSLDERAQELRNQIEDGEFRRTTVTTNESGHYEIRTLGGVETASVQAYKANGKILTGITGPSIGDLRTAHERGYDGSIYLSPAPEHVDVPSSDNTIVVHKSPTPPFGDMEGYESILNSNANDRLNESEAALRSMFEDELQNIGLDELENRHEELKKLIENNDDLQARLEELQNGSLSDGNVSREELESELTAMERSIADLEKQLEAESPETEIDGGEIHGTFPFAGELNEDAVSVLVHYQNGSSDVIQGEYWRVESSSPLGGDQVVIDGYPIPADAAVADIEVTGVSEDGRLGSSRGSVVNPAFDGDVPNIEAIDVSTLRPGVDETVSISVRSDDTAFGSVEDVTVYGPGGAEVPTTTENKRVRFAPEQTGVHSIRVTYSNQGGTNFVETFRLNAKENPTSDPPTVRVIDGIGGPTAIAGDQLESASVSVDGDTAEITAQAPGGESPSNLDVRAETLAVDTIDLSVVTGSNEEAVNNHVSIRLHTDFDGEQTLVYRGSPSEPITDSGDTKYGTWELRENADGDSHSVVQTYTDSSGEVTIDVSRNPGVWEQLVHRFSVGSPVSLPLSSLGGMALQIVEVMTTAGGDGMIGSAGLSTPAPALVDTANTVSGPITAGAQEVIA